MHREKADVVMCSSCFATCQIADVVCSNCNHRLEKNEEGYYGRDAKTAGGGRTHDP